LPLIFVFQLVLFDKIGKFVNPVVILAGKSAIELMRRIRFLVIREDLIQPTLSMLFAVVSMSTLKALEFWLEGSLNHAIHYLLIQHTCAAVFLSHSGLPLL
jgi:hypothetical protein